MTRSFLPLTLALLTCAALPAWSDDSAPLGFLPEGAALFDAPAADLTKPRFEVSWQRWDLERETVNVGRANLGSVLPLWRWKTSRGEIIEWGLDAGVLAVFNMDGRTQDLLNADYSIGMPISWKRDAWSARLRLFHASSHLGDEFLLFEEQPFTLERRKELSYEALEALAAYERNTLRLYAGATRIISAATSIDRNLVQAGAEYTIETARPQITLSVDLQSWDETDWELQLSARAGLRFRSNTRPSRSIELFLEGYDGPLPYGQFYVFDVSWVGIGLRFRL